MRLSESKKAVKDGPRWSNSSASRARGRGARERGARPTGRAGLGCGSAGKAVLGAVEKGPGDDEKMGGKLRREHCFVEDLG